MSERGARRWRLVRATPAAIPASVRRFNSRANRRRLRSARPWAAVALIVILAGLIGWTVYGTSLLGVETIRVTGEDFMSASDIRTAASVPIGSPLASVDTDRVAHRVEGILGVAHADVHRDWPATLVIAVTPRQAVAAAPAGREYVLLDATGVPFRTVSSAAGLTIVVLATPGPGDPSTRAALSVLASLPTALREELVRVEASAPTRIRLKLNAGREIIWGDSTDNPTKGRVAMSLLRRPGTVIDVSAPNVVTVR